MQKLESGIFVADTASLLSEKADPDAILAKGRAYTGTIAVVERLRPYYDHAVDVLNIAGRQEVKTPKFALQVTGDFSNLPPSIENLTINHLGHLQTTADGYEQAGKMEKAEEMRDVMENVYSILKAIHLAQQIEHSGIAKHGATIAGQTKNGN
jgi:hypothetical protein